MGSAVWCLWRSGNEPALAKVPNTCDLAEDTDEPEPPSRSGLSIRR